ncbi:hypothetical protein ACWGNE_23030 [Streptomyces xiamenensis]
MKRMAKNSHPLSRRNLLTAGIGSLSGIALSLTAGGSLAHAAITLPSGSRATEPLEWTWSSSQNGWLIDSEALKRYAIEGSNAEVVLRSGDTADVLLHVARRFSYEIASLNPGSVTGHRSAREVMSEFESNYLSGTALVICPENYPLGFRDGLWPHEIIVVRDILADCEGTVRWGGDLDVPKESHFQIDVAPGDALLGSVAAKIRAWSAQAGSGAGAIDATEPERREAAEALEREQAR